ncbi:nicotinate phosphoribosyltransferase [bacterium]|nr:nicotinate phosphoribosyltransferase [bacterium]
MVKFGGQVLRWLSRILIIYIAEMISETQAKSNSTSKQRLPISVFDLPLHRIRCGFNSAVYFWRAKRILEQDRRQAQVTHQIFQKNEKVVVCGTDEAIAILKCGTGFFKDYEKAEDHFRDICGVERKLQDCLMQGPTEVYKTLMTEYRELNLKLNEIWVDKFGEIEVQSLFDGDELRAWETAMLIEGDYALFAHLESLYLGVLARRTKVATNSRAVVEAANGKPVLFFTDRFDHFMMHAGDGYAAHLSGIAGVACNSMASWYRGEGIGTIPHAMIVAYEGESVAAAEKFHQYYPTINTVSLVDFNNDCVQTALNAARRMGENLWSVRLDTAENLIDRSLQPMTDLEEEQKAGVVPRLVETVRQALDSEGFQHVKIIVSGGFNPNRIAHFEDLNVPVDVYAVGSWILTGRFDFTADAVRLNGKNLAKVGRQYKPNDKLVKV